VTLTSEVVGVSSATTPSGVVTFYNGATAVGQATLDATGSASYTLGGLAGGSYVLTAVYAGSGGLVGSTSPGVTLVVSRYASTTTLTATPNPAGAGQPTTLTAAVSGAAGIATGVVTFYDGGTALGMATLDAGGHAEFSTSTLALGTHDLTAAYAGSAAYGASVSGVVDEVVQTPGFTIALASPSLTLQTYLHTTTGVTLASAGDFSDSLTLACTNAPKYVTCEFAPSPAGLTANGSATVAFYLDTDSIVGGDARQGIWAAILVPLGWMALVRRRRRVAGLMLVVLAVGGCGGSVITKVPSTAPGTYAVNVTATGASSGLQRTAVLMLTVTP
jgi:hypothetical protein